MSKLGMLGAISGLGQGLQDYSKVMQENRKMEWEDKKAQVNYERQLHLQDLSNKQARLLQDDDHTFQSDLYDRKLTDVREAQRDQNTWSVDRDRVRQQDAIDLLKEENRLKQKDREEAATFNTQQRQNKWNQLVEQGVLEGRSEKEVGILRLSVLHPEVYKTIADANKLDEFPVEEHQRQYDKSLAAFPSLDENEKEMYRDMAKKYGIDPREAASLYATRQAMLATRQADLVEEGQRNLTAQEAALEEKRFKEATARKDEVDAEDAALFTDPGRRAQVLQWAKENEKRKKKKEPSINTPATPVNNSPNIEGRVMSGLGDVLSDTAGALQNYKERNFRASQANRGE